MSQIIPTVSLNDGVQLPNLGFGTYKLKGEGGVGTIVDAIHTGYRLLDSAFNYENEGTLGRAVATSGISRDELLLTSKLPGRHHRYEEAIATVEESLYRAGIDAWDIYLIHWPLPAQDRYVEAWRALIECQHRGLVKTIGVCNFTEAYTDRLIQETGVTPAINQIELHPYFSQAPMREYDVEHGIATEAWSPLGRASSVLSDPLLISIAEKHERSVAQIILRWEVQLGTVPLPKATGPERQAQNFDIFAFELSEDEMAQIATLSRPDGRTHDQDPTTYEEF